MIEELYSSLFNTDFFAQTVTYTPQIGVPFTIDVIFDDEYFDAIEVATTNPQITGQLISFLTPPTKGDTVEINSVLYTTKNPEPDSTGKVVTIPLTRQ